MDTTTGNAPQYFTYGIKDCRREERDIIYHHQCVKTLPSSKYHEEKYLSIRKIIPYSSGRSTLMQPTKLKKDTKKRNNDRIQSYYKFLITLLIHKNDSVNRE